MKDSFETRNLECLSSQMKQEILDRTKDSIRALSRQKDNGRRIGALKFKSRVTSIPLKQYGNTWKAKDKNHVELQGVEQKKLRVRGLVQIPEDTETTSALLIRKHGDYYLHVTCYLPRHAVIPSKEKQRSVGVDFGIKNQLTLSNGVAVNYAVQSTIKTRGLQRELAKRKRFSNNWCKTRDKLEKEQDKLVNRKKDIRNKLIHKLTNTFQVICFQDDPIKGWQKKYGRNILATGIGGITCALKQEAQTPIQVNRFFPSTQTCSSCHSLYRIERNERTYRCTRCGLSIDRDLNAARNIEDKGLMMLEEKLPTEQLTRREVTPADTSASTLDLAEYLNSIPGVRASVVVEAGSPAMIVKGTISSRG